MRAFHRWVLEEHRPLPAQGAAVLLLLPCQKRKPYTLSAEHLAVNRIEGRPDVVVTHAGLADRARQQAPDSVVLAFSMFLGDPVFDRLEEAIKEDGTLSS